MELNIQMDYNARHRIILQESDSSLVVEGEWADYRSLAVLHHNGKTYISGTAYGLLPKAETVYDITPVETTIDMSMQHIDAQGADHSEESEDEDTQVVPSPEINPAV